MNHLKLVPGLLICLLVCASAGAQEQAPADEDNPKRLELDLDPKVLVFTEPLREDGTIDYIAAFNKHYSEGVTPENNAFRELFVLFDHTFENVWGEREWDGGKWHIPGMMRVLDLDEQALRRGPHLHESLDDYLIDQGYSDEQLDAFYEADGDDPLAATQRKEVAAWLDLNRPVIDLAIKALAKPRYWAPLIQGDEAGTLIGPLLPNLGNHRTLARAIQREVYFAAAKGDHDRVVECVAALRRLAWHQASEPSLIGALVSISIDALTADMLRELLALRCLPEPVWARIDEQWRSLPRRVDIAQSILIAERCMGLDAYMQIMAGRVGAGDMIGGPGGNDAMGKLMEKGVFDVNRGLKRFSRHYVQIARVAGIKNFAGRQRVQAMLDAQFDEGPMGGQLLVEVGGVKVPNPALLTKEARTDAFTELLMAILTPALDAASRTETRITATEASLLAAIGVERYRLVAGELPQSLETLVPKYLGELPTDPFNDEPVRYRPADSGFVVYTVDANLTDDGGIEYLDERQSERADWIFEVQWGEE